MAEPVMFAREWVVQIEEMLNNDDVSSLPKVCEILLVTRSMLDEKPEAYIPQYISLGPLHHWELGKEYIHSSYVGINYISNAELYKGNSAAKFSHKLRHCGKSFDNIVQMIERMLPEISCFYNWPITTDGDYSKNFALMMAVDSSFLIRFLFTIFTFHDLSQPASGRSHDSASASASLDVGVIRLCSTLQLSIKCDILKLENQIPLYVLREVFEKVKETLIVEKGYQFFNQLLQKTCKEFSPFRTPEIAVSDDCKLLNYDGEPHLLGCMHAFVSQILEMHAGWKEPRPNRTLLQKWEDFLENLFIWVSRFVTASDPKIECQMLKGISAGQLDRAGIKLKSFSNLADKIRVEKCSGTLYLPPIALSDLSTEVFLRNMVALEFNDTLRSKSVTRYVTLMSRLIQSPEDVRLLKGREIIYPEYGPFKDEGIVKMWNGFSQPSFTGTQINISDVKFDRALQELLADKYRRIYYRSEIKRMIWGFTTIWGLVDYFSSWKFIAPLCGFLALAMTAIQTYCILSDWLVSSGNNSKP